MYSIVIENKNNIIQKQVLNLRYKGKADGFALQREFTDWYYRELFPEMQAMMDQLAPDHIHVRLDKLEVDLVIKGTTEWKQVLRKQALENLNKKIQAEIYFNSQVKGIIAKDAAGNFFSLFKYYVQKGVLPWWSSIKTKKEFDEELEEWFLSADEKNYTTGIKEILQDKDAVYRIAVLFEDKNFERFIQFSSGSDKLVKNFQELKQDVSMIAALLPAIKKSSFNLLLKQVVLGKIAGTKLDLQTISTAFADRSALQFADEIKNIDLSVIRSKPLKEAFAHNKAKTFFQQIPVIEKEEKKEITNDEEDETSGKLKRITGEKNIALPDDDKKNLEDNDIPLAKKSRSAQDKPVVAGKEKGKTDQIKEKDISVELKEGVFVHNAGLVIIASFLPMLFKKLSLVDANEINDINKAVMLVQYLASGKENVADFELGLAKILCGSALDIPVDTTIVLTTEEKEEANELLLSAIEYWSILGHTSVQGLRDSFLMREGKLSFAKNDWLLQVEQKPYDMLLQNLPWNISMIKLSWMRSLLKTEWIY